MTRKYFGTDGVRGRVGEATITVEFVLKLGNAFGRALKDAMDNRAVVVGQDTRASGDMLKAAFISGITAAGVDVINLGVVPTPVIAFMTRSLNAAAGVVLSASHNPHYDNGIKLFSSEGHKLSDEMEYQIENYIENGFVYQEQAKFGQISSQINEIEPYIAFCLEQFAKQINLAGKKIVLDCAHGATYRLARDVFSRLNVQFVEISSSPNGFNVNEDCGTVHLEKLSDSVINMGADLGIAFDGDGDRIMLVDGSGCVVDGDDILLLLAKHQSPQSSVENGLVGTVMTNLSIEQEAKKQGLEFVRAKVGDRCVMEVLLQKKWHLGGEASGHIINLRYNSTGDGVMTALQVLAILSKLDRPLSELIGVKKMPQIMINVPLTRKLGADDLSLLIEDVSFVERQLGDEGRVVLRPSGTEPVLRVMVEAVSVELARKWVDYLVEKSQIKLV